VDFSAYAAIKKARTQESKRKKEKEYHFVWSDKSRERSFAFSAKGMAAYPFDVFRVANSNSLERQETQRW
jgi:hypothetical protein